MNFRQDSFKKYLLVMIAALVALANVALVDGRNASAQGTEASSLPPVANFAYLFDGTGAESSNSGKSTARALVVAPSYQLQVTVNGSCGNLYTVNDHVQIGAYTPEAGHLSFYSSGNGAWWQQIYGPTWVNAGHASINAQIYPPVGNELIYARLITQYGTVYEGVCYFQTQHAAPPQQELYAEIVWSGTPYAPAYRVKAYDPYVGNYDGAGIDYVDFYIYDWNGNQIHSQREQQAAYCAFGGTHPCGAWDFGQHNYAWPSGHQVQNGTYKLVAKVYAKNGQHKTVEKHFDIHVTAPQPQELYTKLHWVGYDYAPAFWVEAYDPHVGNYDGAGIKYVDFYVYDWHGNQVYKTREEHVAYCLFGGNDSCNVWNFGQHNYTWPSGHQVQNGTYKLVTKVYAKNGQHKSIEKHFDIHVTAPAPQPIYAEIVWGGHQHAPALRVKAYNPHVGNYDGAGIHYVDFYIYDWNGKQVHYKRENSAAYCSFGGNHPCGSWKFSQHSYKWPSGHHVQNGTYKLVAKVYAKDGQTKTIATHFQVYVGK